MKNFKFYVFAVVALVMGVSLASCQNDPDTDNKGNGKLKVEVKVASVEPGGATIQVVTSGIKEFAYVADQELPETAIFVAGETKTIADPTIETTTTLTILGKDVNTDVTIYFAFRKSDDTFYGKVETVQFTTTNYEGTLTVVDRCYDGYAVHVVVPAETKARGNALRYATASLPMYNYSKMEGAIEIDMLLYNAMQYTTEDKTVRYDEQNSYERDEEGNIIEDGAGYADTMTPGEPAVFLIGEYSYMDDPDELLVYMDMDGDGVKEVETVSVAEGDENFINYVSNAIWAYPAGWNPGYFMPMYDWKTWCEEVDTDAYDSEKYWLGYYERINVRTLEPDSFDGGVKISNYAMTPINGIVSLEPTENVAFYNVMIMEESEFQTVILPLLNNNEEYLKWFTASYFAMMTFGSQMIAGCEPTEIQLKGWFVDMKGMQGKEIRVLCTSMGDKNGRTQMFDTYKFTMPVVTKPAPEIVVTPGESKDPHVACFNIKAPNKDAYEVYYACDYVREFDAALKNTTYGAFMRELGEGNKFSDADIKKINSPEGLDFIVPSRAEATTRMAVLVYNDEGTANNNLNDPESSAIAEYTSPAEKFPVRVNSSLFEELVGEWTASATMIDYNADNESWEPMTEKYTSDVTIVAGVEYPETLPEDIYDLYAKNGFDRDETDAFYEEFVELAERYNARTRGFNRLLCLGYDLTASDYMLDLVATPYELFTMEDYSSSQVSHMFYDFGPKWNLEIDDDGTVWLPIDINFEYPMSTWNMGIEYTFYMLAVGTSSYIGAPLYAANGEKVCDARFPVEVSEDRNTLTIKPFKYTFKDNTGKTVTDTYYPCVAQLKYGSASPTTPRVGGDVVLTRKTSATPAQKNASVVSKEAPALKSVGKAPVPVVRPNDRTNVKSVKIREFKEFVPETKYEPGMDALNRRMETYIEKTYGVKLQ